MEKKRASNLVEEEAGVLKSGYVTAAFLPSVSVFSEMLSSSS